MGDWLAQNGAGAIWLAEKLLKGRGQIVWDVEKWVKKKALFGDHGWLGLFLLLPNRFFFWGVPGIFDP